MSEVEYQQLLLEHVVMNAAAEGVLGTETVKRLRDRIQEADTLDDIERLWTTLDREHEVFAPGGYR